MRISYSLETNSSVTSCNLSKSSHISFPGKKTNQDLKVAIFIYDKFTIRSK